MDKTHRIELCRRFLLERLPEPLTRADRHQQIFDNYIAQTRLRLRTVRVPETKKRTWILQQRSLTDESLTQRKIAEIHLNEAEYHAFKSFEGREIRKNRYLWNSNGKQIEIDVFLGKLQGLIMARVTFETADELRDFQFPFAVLEVTNDEFFNEENLVESNFADVHTRTSKIV